MKNIIKKLIPKKIIYIYHKFLAILANVFYGFPSKNMIVVGVTGTKGKSSTCYMLTKILEMAGFKTGSTNTIFLKTGEKESPNDTKQGMPGRFKMQKLLKEMSSCGCTHAVIEATSEGIAQNRHWGIDFSVAVFTNLSPEHISSHGSYENYLLAKTQIFKNLKKGKLGKTVIVANGCDKEAEKFLKNPSMEKWSICSSCENCFSGFGAKILKPTKVNATKDGISFFVEDVFFNLKLHGEFMMENALLAASAAMSLGVSLDRCASALSVLSEIPGRSEFLKAKSGANIVIDYAHEPKSFGAIFKMADSIKGLGRIISVFGGTGGGRDKEKLPKMGEIASKYSDFVILTTDDPYDDDPMELALEIKKGIPEDKNATIVLSRKDAILEASKIAKQGDIVLILGKGSEKTMAVSGGKYIPWSDLAEVREIFCSE